ncbi:hypothetical protein N9A94_00990 [Akkermansiaceae bacterium]|nr:hypothetical protein [Akkermansiaceae bacterium]
MKWQLLVQPHPVARPIVDEAFLRLPAWKRSLASIAYCLRCLEHWIAPQGWVREWIRLNILAVVLAGTTILLAGPIVTAILLSLLDWSNLSTLILIKVMTMVAVLPPLVLAIVSAVFLWKLVRRQRGQIRNPHQNAPYYE